MKFKASSRILIAAGFLGAALSAHATVVWNFSSVYTGATPSGSTPWATLSISNGANARPSTYPSIEYDATSILCNYRKVP